MEIERHFVRREVDGKPIHMTLSIGIAKYPDDSTVGERLLARAEEALYQAKARGANSVAVYYRERRNFIRFDPSRRALNIELQAADPQTSEEDPAVAKNVSRSGLMVETGRPYGIGESVVVKCHDASGSDQLTLRGRVVRVEELDERGLSGRFDVGIAFLLEWEHQEAEVARFLQRERMRPG